MILITGAAGLIGRHLAERLEEAGQAVRRFDRRRAPREDITDRKALGQALRDVEGVVHLAAVSRVAWAERRPLHCKAVNITALQGLLGLCLQCKQRPWVVFASSREVYGNARRLPVSEDADLRPLNVYARSKCEGERLVRSAAEAGLCANIVRFSNVYGCSLDHPDRVAVAFARAAALGGVMRLEGAENTFDFTAVGDVSDGLAVLARATASGERLPPIHLASGQATSLRQLASIAARHARASVRIKETGPRAYNVSHFVGDPRNATRLLGWRSATEISLGMSRLIEGMGACQGALTCESV